ncbi:hypothetical protein CVT25_009232 [Psilocybe cyanescens]|uniref:Uncharacterized protein n=1 Tax=Psilocybe cyanescens TaxID=93625 RepID=A0A409WWB6_PSICY|nr:hypothetical protein CVT25_009232 [Psilocybe cyanescens]
MFPCTFAFALMSTTQLTRTRPLLFISFNTRSSLLMPPARASPTLAGAEWPMSRTCVSRSCDYRPWMMSAGSAGARAALLLSLALAVMVSWVEAELAVAGAGEEVMDVGCSHSEVFTAGGSDVDDPAPSVAPSFAFTFAATSVNIEAETTTGTVDDPAPELPAAAGAAAGRLLAGREGGGSGGGGCAISSGGARTGGEKARNDGRFAC